MLLRSFALSRCSQQGVVIVKRTDLIAKLGKLQMVHRVQMLLDWANISQHHSDCYENFCVQTNVPPLYTPAGLAVAVQFPLFTCSTEVHKHRGWTLTHTIYGRFSSTSDGVSSVDQQSLICNNNIIIIIIIIVIIIVHF